jgi:outer membrane protein assembly factor BamB
MPKILPLSFALLLFLAVFIAIPGLSQRPDEVVVTPAVCWKYRSTGLMSNGPAIDVSNLYVAEEGGRVSAVSLANGTRIWSTEVGGENRSNIVVAGTNIYLASSEGQNRLRIHSLSTSTGIPNSEIEIPFSEDIKLISAAGKLIVLSSEGSITAYSFGSYHQEWQLIIPRISLETTLYAANRLYLASSDKKLHSIDVESGVEADVINAKNDVTAIGIVDGSVVFGDSRGNLIRQNRSGRSWRFRNGAKIVSIGVTDRGIVAASADNFVYLVSSYYGDIRWKKRMPGRVSSLVIDDDLIAVQTVGEASSALLNLESGKMVGQVTIADDEAFIRSPAVAEGKLIFFTSKQLLAESTHNCS